MISLFANAFKDVINVQNSQRHETLTNKKDFFNVNTRNNIVVLKNVLIHKKQPQAFVRVLYLLKQSSIYQHHDPISLVSNALEYLRPLIIFRFKKVAGVRHRLPFIKTKGTTRDQFQAVYWLLEGASKRVGSNKDYSLKLFEEIIDVLNRRGFSIKARSLYHKLALSQRPALKFL